MIGKTLLAIYWFIDRWWFADRWWFVVFMVVALGYCIWLFATTINAYLNSQMYFWGQNLGM